MATRDLHLQLGDIIEIQSPTDSTLYNKQFIIQYIDPSIIKLLDSNGNHHDLIIDDGWHHPEAQINSLIAYLPYLNFSGTYIVEDIVHKDYYNLFQKVKV